MDPKLKEKLMRDFWWWNSWVDLSAILPPEAPVDQHIAAATMAEPSTMTPDEVFWKILPMIEWLEETDILKLINLVISNSLKKEEQD